MKNPIKTIVKEYGWIHLTIGLCGNLMFFVGSILFFERFKEYKDIGVWLFVFGSFFMLLGALGRLLVDVLEKEKET